MIHQCSDSEGLTRKKVCAILKKTAKELGPVDIGRDDCFVCCILSHGDVNGLLRTYYHGPTEYVTISEVCDRFTVQECPALFGKPKIFIFDVSNR